MSANTNGKKPDLEEILAQLRVDPVPAVHCGSPKRSSQIVFQTNSNRKIGTMSNGWRSPRKRQHPQAAEHAVRHAARGGLGSISPGR